MRVKKKNSGGESPKKIEFDSRMHLNKTETKDTKKIHLTSANRTGNKSEISQYNTLSKSTTDQLREKYPGDLHETYFELD